MNKPKMDVQQRLARARALREKTAGYVLSDKELADAKREGRQKWDQLLERTATR